MSKYLIRLDDACPTMDANKWQRVENILDKYNIKPMVGIIPHNEDELQKIDKEDVEFWNKAKTWQNKGWAIALHGYNHCYITDHGLCGINPMWKRSEFAGVSLDKQCEKIRNGVSILKSHGITPRYFFAPSHTFDKNTLQALVSESDIRTISDTVSLNPYIDREFLYIPQIVGHCMKMPINGVFTFCFHPNTMNETSYDALETFLSRHSRDFTDFESIRNTKHNRKAIIDKLISWFFFLQRKLRGLK